MEEETGVKAPVTRLRRRLSVEQPDDVKSPGPATPTKKRGGRLAAKPQLELIDEHGADLTPTRRSTRKASAKEAVEAAEEKVVTPSRRSTRIKSNTSIVSEMTQSFDSPRAKRAARRTSQVGSDSESTVVTPVRQTRRTRKDSTSSIENLELTLSGKPNITEVIIEEETLSVKSDDTTKGTASSPSSVRKSPRLKEKQELREDGKSIDESSSGVNLNDSPNKTLSVKSDDTTKGTASSPSSVRKSPRLKEKQELREDGKSIDESSSGVNLNDSPNKSSKENKNGMSLEHENVDPNQSINRESIEQRSAQNDLLINSPTKENKQNSKERKSIGNRDATSNDNLADGDLNTSKHNRKRERKSTEQDSAQMELNSSSVKENLNISKESRKQEKKSTEQSSDHVDNVNKSISEQDLNISKQNRKSGRKSIVKSSNDNEIHVENFTDDKLNEHNNKMEETENIETSDGNMENSIVKVQLNNSNQLENQAIDSPVKSTDTDIVNNNSTQEKLKTPKHNISDSSLLNIKELDSKPKRKSSLINKSTSALDNLNSFQNKRQRTKSWTVTSVTQENDGMFLSDNEMTIKKLCKKASKNIKRQSNHTGSGDNDKEKSIIQGTNDNLELEPNKGNISLECKTPNKSLNTESDPQAETISSQGNKENILAISSEKVDEVSRKFFERAPTSKLQSTVFFEDSDTDSKGKKENRNIQMDAEDQCVPVVDKKLVEETVPLESNRENSISIQKNDNLENSCEPMDIDETIPTNVSIIEFPVTTSNKSYESSDPKPVLHSPLLDTSSKKSTKPKRKSSLTNLDNFEKSGTENKSTLILSQLKDVSSSEHSVSKSPRCGNETLSKSIGPSEADKAKESKNLSKDYSTSTPLQQKTLKKLGMQINSSIINTSNIENKKDKFQNVSEKDMSKSSDISSEDDFESDAEESSTNDRSKFLDNEADEASDDYESGDSQDEDERQYEEENQIVEKGETLDSEDDVSNDTDYEHDSFVVSSDEEDNELLSGSGDDLSMSDKELSMSKKSKKKYDERKVKEQKKASREMYEARHKLDGSDISKAKKNKKRQQIESSEESDNEVAPVKKNNRLRLNSTQDDKDASNTSFKKKGKSKRLSESVCEEKPTQDQEISTVISEVNETVDPLSVQVKLEPKTPMKELNISTVQINENIEEVQLDNNASIMKPNEGEDPLQATMFDEGSSMSENSDIRNNYDSILNELNNASEIKTVKSHDTSLNIVKKTKQNIREPIVDQLNLTKTKNTKSNKKQKVTKDIDISTKAQETLKAGNDSSSSSVVLKLLFSEDSNDHDNIHDKSAKGKNLSKNVKEDFIPLKKTPGKTNILAGGDNVCSETQTMLNESTKKKNKKLNSHHEIEERTGDDQTNNNDIQIIIDTQGIYASKDIMNMSLTNSAKKKKKRDSVTLTKDEDNVSTTLNAVDDEAPEVSFITKKDKKKNRKSSESHAEVEVQLREDDTEKLVNTSSNLNSAKKKKKKLSESYDNEAKDHEVSLNKSPKVGSEKKNRKKLSETLEEEKGNNLDALNKSIGSAKKKKQKTDVEHSAEINEEVQYNLEETSNNKKRKRKSSASETIDNNIFTEDKVIEPIASDISISMLQNVHQKKKRKISENDGVDIQTQDGAQKKKNKKRKERDNDDQHSVSKIFKENSFDRVPISRLPSSIINQLDEKPRKEVLESKKSSLVSTTPFIVEETRKKRNKPSKFLEESVYLNDSHIEKKQKGNLKNPKVLPFIPTAVTSGSGFTTNFKINVLPQEFQFVAQTKNAVNFKNEYLYGKKIKRLGTYETYKKTRNVKLSKF